MRSYKNDGYIQQQQLSSVDVDADNTIYAYSGYKRCWPD